MRKVRLTIIDKLLNMALRESNLECLKSAGEEKLFDKQSSWHQMEF